MRLESRLKALEEKHARINSSPPGFIMRNDDGFYRVGNNYFATAQEALDALPENRAAGTFVICKYKAKNQ